MNIINLTYFTNVIDIFLFRYQCVDCDNYNLCQKCNQANVHPHHGNIVLPFSIYHHQLPMLIHAQLCQKQNQKKFHYCHFQPCVEEKADLYHIALDHDKSKCKVSSCLRSSRVVRHWNICDKLQCSWCQPIMQVLLTQDKLCLDIDLD